jgi:hypothetical protein
MRSGRFRNRRLGVRLRREHLRLRGHRSLRGRLRHRQRLSALAHHEPAGKSNEEADHQAGRGAKGAAICRGRRGLHSQQPSRIVVVERRVKL